jgi:hypothetical protein
MSNGDCEIAQYYKAQERTARKQHECCECSAPILSGERYLEVRACWENRPDVYRQHILCEKACEFVRDSGINDDECLYYGGLKEWYHEWVKSGNHLWENFDERKKMWLFLIHIARRERQARATVQKTPDFLPSEKTP